jgi:hypothetical protein
MAFDDGAIVLTNEARSGDQSFDALTFSLRLAVSLLRIFDWCMRARHEGACGVP